MTLGQPILRRVGPRRADRTQISVMQPLADTCRMPSPKIPPPARRPRPSARPPPIPILGYRSPLRFRGTPGFVRVSRFRLWL